MKSMFAATAALVVAMGSAWAAEPVPQLPDRPASEQFRGVSEPWREHFIAVRAVQGIQDPMARCLAWPDLPGSTLPEGHVEAHCRSHFTPMPTPQEVEAHLDAGTLDELAAQLEARFAGHHGVANPDESVHVFFNQFGRLAVRDAATANRITQRWLEVSPDSAHATIARARVLERQGWAARGGDFASETSAEQFAAMAEFFAQAMPLYARAIELDGRLTDSYQGLISIAKNGGYPGLEQVAMEQARAQVPGCQEIAREYLVALQPKWGGSLEQMGDFIRALEPAMASAPLLVNQRAAPYVLMVGAAHQADSSTAEQAAAVDQVALHGTNEDLFDLAAAGAVWRTDGSETDDASGVGYLLQRLRFNGLYPWQQLRLSSYLVHRGEAEWALHFAMGALESEPDSPLAHYRAGVANFNLRRYDEAEAHYIAAREDPEHAEFALSGLVTMWLLSGVVQDGLVDRARPFLEEMIERFPENNRGKAAHIVWLAMTEGLSDDRLEEFLATADRRDRLVARVAAAMEAARADAVPAPGR